MSPRTMQDLHFTKSHGFSIRLATPQGTRFIHLGTHDRAAADLALKDKAIQQTILTAMRESISLSSLKSMSGQVITWREAINQWVLHIARHDGLQEQTVDNYRKIVEAFANANGLMTKAVGATPDDKLVEYLHRPDQTRLSRRRLAHVVIRRFYDWASARGYLMGNPARVIRKVNGRPLPVELKEVRLKKPFTDEELDRVRTVIYRNMARYQQKLDAMQQESLSFRTEIELVREKWRCWFFWEAAIILSLHAGLRLGDCCLIEWASLLPSDINPDGNMLVFTHKRDRRLSIEMPPAIKDLVPKLIAQRQQPDDRYVFPHVAKQYHDCPPLLPTKFAAILKEAKIKGRSFHCLRVTYAHRCRAAGASPEHIQHALTHLDGKVTLRYLGGKA